MTRLCDAEAMKVCSDRNSVILTIWRCDVHARACSHVLGTSSATAQTAPLCTWAVAYIRIKCRGAKIGSQQPYSITLQVNGPWPAPKENSYHPEIRSSCDHITEVSLYMCSCVKTFHTTKIRFVCSMFYVQISFQLRYWSILRIMQNLTLNFGELGIYTK
uniref:Uncharacterized protein n=1 Tax=Rhipicephalus appendiculatus TaxID=34631 RepID=A0A131YJQ1_RHIAP